MIRLSEDDYMYEVQTSLKPTQTAIYALTDPLTLEIRYIGKALNPSARYMQHLNSPTSEYMSDWIYGLLKKGKQPRMFILEHIRNDHANARELKYIRQYTEMGANLLNKECRTERKRTEYHPAFNQIPGGLLFIEHLRRRRLSWQPWDTPAAGAYIHNNRYSWQFDFQGKRIEIRKTTIDGSNPSRLATLLQQVAEKAGLEWPRLPDWQYEKWWKETGRNMFKRCYRLHAQEA